MRQAAGGRPAKHARPGGGTAAPGVGLPSRGDASDARRPERRGDTGAGSRVRTGGARGFRGNTGPRPAAWPRGRRLPSIVIATILGLGVAAGPRLVAHAAEATVAVATNFLLPLRSLAEEFTARTGHALRISSGSTGQLYAQITNGAPYDVFLSADAARPLRLEEAGATLPGTRRTYALGRIVLWSAQPGRVDAGGAEALGTLGNGKIAIANPEVAPYGVASQETLERLGFWEPFQDRLVRGINVAQVFQFIGTGNAAMGFIAMSQLGGRPEGCAREHLDRARRAPRTDPAGHGPPQPGRWERGRVRVPRLPRLPRNSRPHRGIRVFRSRGLMEGRNAERRRWP